MADSGVAEQHYVIILPRVRESVQALLERETHPYFIAYLHLHRLASRVASTRGLVPNWAELGSLLEVRGAPSGKPYLRPFWKGSREAGQEWLNSNLAGSFAASSLRGVPLKVVETDARGHFGLREQHAELALHHLLLGKRMPVLALATFLFRDFGFAASSSPTAPDLIDVFRFEYGYVDEEGVGAFDLLYDPFWPQTSRPWFQPLEDGEMA